MDSSIIANEPFSLLGLLLLIVAFHFGLIVGNSKGFVLAFLTCTVASVILLSILFIKG